MNLQEVLEELERQLPAWMKKGQAIRIFAGIELGIKKFQGKPWEIKTVRCNLCGECCTLSIPGTSGINPETEYCKHLIESGEPGKRICELGVNRPFNCCAYAASPKDLELCSIRWKSIE